jgi:hypothetical protein
LLALLGTIVLMRLPASSQWRRQPYNWQQGAGIILIMVAVLATAFLHELTGDAHYRTGDHCNGLYGWLTVAFVADIVLCVPVAVLAIWFTVRQYPLGGARGGPPRR